MLDTGTGLAGRAANPRDIRLGNHGRDWLDAGLSLPRHNLKIKDCCNRDSGWGGSSTSGSSVLSDEQPPTKRIV